MAAPKSFFMISAAQITAVDKNGSPTSLGNQTQGSGAHLGNLTINADARFQEIFVKDNGGREDWLEDSTAGQLIQRNTVIDGVRYAPNTNIENEYRVTLQDSSGKLYYAWAIEIEDGGIGPDFNNVVGYAFRGGEVPPFGETLTVVENLDLFNLPQDNQEEFRYSTGVTCFTAGIRVDTPMGALPVEDLRPGMKVWTLDNGAQEVIWAGRRNLGAAELEAAPHLKPVVIQPGALGNARGLMVSRQHRLALTDTLEDHTAEMRRFARATLLADQAGMRLRHAMGCRNVSYVHFMCETHQIVRSEGLWSETFYPGAEAMKALGPAARAEINALFPGLYPARGPARQAATSAYGALAREEISRGALRRAGRAA